jgi:excisionase family DNA binding protein
MSNVQVVTLTREQLEELLDRAIARAQELHAEPPRTVFDSREAGKFVKRSAKVMERMARAKEIPAFRVGRQYRFRREDLEAWALAHKVA